MLIIALVLALTGLIALVFAVVTSNVLVAWVCIGASALGVILLIFDALRERQRRDSGNASEQPAQADTEAQLAEDAGTDSGFDADYPEDAADLGDQDSDSGLENEESGTP